MNHSFNVELAKEYGILEAILIENISFWIAKNEANGENFHDGRTWTYNSVRAFQELFPYATIGQIRRALSHLVKEGILVTGNYNEIQYDRTLWYAFSDSAKTILKNRNIHLSNLKNGIAKNEQPIPDINTNINTDNKPDNKHEAQAEPALDAFSYQSKEVLEYLNEKAGKRYKAVDRNLKHIKARLREGFTVDDCKSVIDKKCAEWAKNERMNQYLRCETLFGGKFESYLNQNGQDKPEDKGFWDVSGEDSNFTLW